MKGIACSELSSFTTISRSQSLKFGRFYSSPNNGHVATVRLFLSGVATLRAGRFYTTFYTTSASGVSTRTGDTRERRKAPGSVGADRRKALPRSSVRRVSHGRVNRRAPGNVRDGATTGRKDDAEARTNKGRETQLETRRGRTDGRTCSRTPLGLGRLKRNRP